MAALPRSNHHHSQPLAVGAAQGADRVASEPVLPGVCFDASNIPFLPFAGKPGARCSERSQSSEGVSSCPNQDGTNPHESGATDGATP